MAGAWGLCTRLYEPIFGYRNGALRSYDYYAVRFSWTNGYGRGQAPVVVVAWPHHWVLYSTRVLTGLMDLLRALQVSLPGWAHSHEGGPNRHGVAWGARDGEFDACCR